jgi:flavin reductase (DIM6/NTAB) family NADH-FMN oxidoreductase RutF
MTISWLSPLDNDGRFTLSLNARRFTARMLAANPVLSLSVATAGIEETLRRVGGCSGRVVDKPRGLGVLLCRPGWGQLESDDIGSAAAVAQVSPGAAAVTVSTRPSRCTADRDFNSEEESTPELQRQVDESTAEAGHDWPAWPDGCVQRPNAGSLEGAVAVAQGVAAHVVARVDVATPRHGHFLLECQAIHAYVRRAYWSGKTLEPQQPGLPAILTFFGSQRFGNVTVAQASDPASGGGRPLRHEPSGPGE